MRRMPSYDTVIFPVALHLLNRRFAPQLPPWARPERRAAWLLSLSFAAHLGLAIAYALAIFAERETGKIACVGRRKPDTKISVGCLVKRCWTDLAFCVSGEFPMRLALARRPFLVTG